MDSFSDTSFIKILSFLPFQGSLPFRNVSKKIRRILEEAYKEMSLRLETSRFGNNTYNFIKVAKCFNLTVKFGKMRGGPIKMGKPRPLPPLFSVDDAGKEIINKIEHFYFDCRNFSEAELEWLSQNMPKKLSFSNCSSVDDYVLNSLLKASPSISSLSVTNCSVTAGCCETISSLPFLNTLNLTGNPISNEGLANLGTLTNLKDLNLMSCEISDISVLSSLPNLSTLDLTNNKIQDQGAEILSKMPSLRHLTVDYCEITTKGVKELVNLKELISFSIASNNLADFSCEMLLDLPKLKHLNISTNSLVDSQFSPVCNINTLKTLKSYENRLSYEGLENIENLKKLVELDLSANKISSKGIIYISNCVSLKKLVLASNCFDKFGMTGLHKLINLSYLDFGFNSAIGDEGVLHISKIPRLTEIYLIDIDLTDQGCRHFEESKCKATYFNVEENHITAKGKEILENLQRRPTVSGGPNDYDNYARRLE